MPSIRDFLTILNESVESDIVTGPAHWASYLINGDDSGLDPEEKIAADKWQEKLKPWYVVGIETDEEPRFTWHYDIHSGTDTRGGSVIDYIVHKSGTSKPHARQESPMPPTENEPFSFLKTLNDSTLSEAFTKKAREALRKKRKENKHSLSNDPWLMGDTARHEDKKISDNPFEKDSEDFKDWEEGWKDANRDLKKINESANDKEVATEILRQLGGNKFIAMTGAKNFIAIEKGLSFKIPKTNKINFVRIKLNSNDLYDIEFLSATFTAKSFRPPQLVKEYTDVPVENLRKIFEQTTGLRTSLRETTEKKKEPTEKQIEALRSYAELNGDRWKARLIKQWEDGACKSSTLIVIKNNFGPDWLKKFKLPEE